MNAITFPPLPRQPLDACDLICIERQIVWPLQAMIHATGDYAHPDVEAATADLKTALAKFDAVLRAGAEVSG